MSHAHLAGEVLKILADHVEGVFRAGFPGVGAAFSGSSNMAGAQANGCGCQNWHPAMICWGLGGFGVGLTGALKVNTKEDMAENSRMIVLWGANIASQPNTARHLISARRRGAKVVTIDVRRTEAAAQSDEVLLIRPGSDAALALAVMHVIITERLYDPALWRPTLPDLRNCRPTCCPSLPHGGKGNRP